MPVSYHAGDVVFHAYKSLCLLYIIKTHSRIRFTDAPYSLRLQHYSLGYSLPSPVIEVLSEVDCLRPTSWLLYALAVLIGELDSDMRPNSKGLSRISLSVRLGSFACKYFLCRSSIKSTTELWSSSRVLCANSRMLKFGWSSCFSTNIFAPSRLMLRVYVCDPRFSHSSAYFI